MGNDKIQDLLKTVPAVFAVGKTYQIMVPVKKDCIMWVRIGDEMFADSCQGIMRSHVPVHRICVPMEKLDKARGYTVIYKEIIERKPYMTETKEAVEQVFAFRPITARQSVIRIYHVSDAHSKVEPVVNAASYFGEKLDLLVMNGDMPNHSGKTEYFDNIYRIAGSVTKGEIPIVFARGNHDCRGFYAESMGEYIPMENQRTYYTFRLGPIWGMVLDCGEDKTDSHEEYGSTVWFHEYRKEETAFLKEVVRRSDMEYEENGICYRVIIVHNPFTRVMEPPFNIEREIYSEWAKLLREQIKPDVMLCGHTHETRVYETGGEMDHLGQACPVVIGGDPGAVNEENGNYRGAAFTLQNGEIRAAFTDALKKVQGEYLLKARSEN